MAKHVLSVGFVFPGDICEFVPLNSTRSLLDADIVIFRPSVAPFRFTEYHDSNYQGNAFRLQPLSERPKQYFTDKCLTSAARTQTALVRTPDLFMVAKYIKETGDIAYAVMCRKAIVEHAGKVVVFPLPPQATSSPTESLG